MKLPVKTGALPKKEPCDWKVCLSDRKEADRYLRYGLLIRLPEPTYGSAFFIKNSFTFNSGPMLKRVLLILTLCSLLGSCGEKQGKPEIAPDRDIIRPEDAPDYSNVGQSDTTKSQSGQAKETNKDSSARTKEKEE